MLEYKVTKQFSSGPESTLGNFTQKELAEKLIFEKLADDVKYKVQTTYRLYDDLDSLIKLYTEADLPSDASSQGSSDQSKRFAPTPFNTKPQPGGLPHSWVKEDDDKEKDES